MYYDLVPTARSNFSVEKHKTLVTSYTHPAYSQKSTGTIETADYTTVYSLLLTVEPLSVLRVRNESQS